ncbi:sensor histidine kinase [Desertivirga xinjiangensis]|uniref:sensor histidine kinase n=1 Tax=Desertivirga xinjiangensis TaxID=539206 RepID=UPI00210E89DE|nr:HAMP domain-containing sensor histidine kinase [Pedobacter xinjiangensis]
MKKKSISLIIGLMSLALFGVMAMQYYFIRESYNQKAQLFDLSINSSLSEVANKLLKQDAKRFVNRKAVAEERLKRRQEIERERHEARARDERFSERIKDIREKIEQDFKARDSAIRTRYPRIMTIDNDFYETYFRDPNQLNKVRLQVKLRQSVDTYGQVFQDEIHELYVEGGPTATKTKKASKIVKDSVHYLVEDPNTGMRVVSLPRINPRLKKELEEEQRQQEAEKLAFLHEQKRREVHKIKTFFDSVKTVNPRTDIFVDIANEYEHFDIPLLQRISPVDTLLKTELENHGINLPYNFKISLANSDSVIFSQVSSKEGVLLSEDSYQIALFPKEVVNQSGTLTVDFPTKNAYMFQNMYSVLISSAGLLIILIGCFSYTIYIIFRQKKLSEIKNDFINNMTHEFKTPVATIMIASEALKDPEVADDSQRINRLASIIYDENVRLGSHIERVLNIAKIDQGDLKLEFKPVEMNDLIGAIADSMTLQFQKKSASLTLDLNASYSVVNGDELHLSNIIFNLIDNALKYSKENPEIKISTLNSGKNLIIKVQDNGIGMNKDQLSKIFEQFYRIPTGNLHDVKGFGLGLSYVDNIVKQHHGNIRVKSEKDKGSEFEIIFSTHT